MSPTALETTKAPGDVKEDSVVTTEIKRANWSKFCRQFNETNQFRTSSLSVKYKRKAEVQIAGERPFVGLAITRKGRAFAGIELHTAKADPTAVHETAVAIQRPEKILLERTNDGQDASLTLESKDGTVVRVELNGDRSQQTYESFVREVAYAMYQNRGQHGRDREDWFEAERKINEASTAFVQ
ncbi:MAG: DUF2934 domain-containing protein [candidate division Zixibacteria bacterium]|nr:DUF2934 domain-containing protein [candidate division Zixibacteria bacterium]